MSISDAIDQRISRLELEQALIRSDARDERISRLEKAWDQQKQELNQPKQAINEQAQERMIMLNANALIDLAQRTRKKSQNVPIGAEQEEDPPMPELQDFVGSLTDTQLTDMAIPPPVWPLLRKLDGVNPQPALILIYAIIHI